MSGDKVVRHIAATMVFSLFLMTVVLVVGLLDPYALVPLIFFFPVGLIAAWLVWALTFSDMPLPSKIIRFGLYVLLCILTVAMAHVKDSDLMGTVFITMILPALGMLIFHWFFPAPTSADVAEGPDEA
ncbi:hypothetical protein F2P45_22295 [Massilia sp. CCM 8733]|uniref:Transmembrane protein n=1 Tax=Massilia mucilaginosa TaxID=2609282 RepID=A0ABX0NXM2_9BURK|nr:hypothetical protein [Massilia mucilaginosa]NHZ91716.1 hypothetical protein [Massilia mucilaginosa]